MTHSKNITPIIPRALVVNDDATQLKVLCGLIEKAGLKPVAFKMPKPPWLLWVKMNRQH